MDKKKKISLTINNTTPNEIPFWTLSVWAPKKLASVIISLNQSDIPQFNNIKELSNNMSPIGYPWNDNTALNVRLNNTPDNIIGHGDWSTIW